MSAVDHLTAAVRAADTLGAGGDPLRVESSLAAAVGAAAAALGADHPDVLAASCRLAALYRERGELSEARRVLETVVESGRRVHGTAHPSVLEATYGLALVADELDNAYEARRNFDRLVRLGPAVLGAEHLWVVAARQYLGLASPAPAAPVLIAPVTAVPVSGAPVTAVPVSADPVTAVPAPAAPGSAVPVSVAPAASVPMAETPERDGAEPVPGRSRRLMVIGAVVGVVVVVLVAVVLAVVRTGGDRGAAAKQTARDVPAPAASAAVPPPGPAPSAGEVVPSAGGPGAVGPSSVPRSNAPAQSPTPAGPRTFNGRYLIRPAHTGLCIGEGPELFKNTGRTVLGQHACANVTPATRLEPTGTNVYRILLEGSGVGPCASVDYDGTYDGLLLAGRACNNQPNQRFTLEPVSAPAVGYRLRSVSGPQYCIGVLEGKKQDGVQIMQANCSGGAGEVYTLEAR
ncbi:RICIN domain-containing protein [Virgisporangium aliadipatigenens]|uniref:RICIN domain-containing protein n=1 Tax=Virgisporangium aliadipatigenens TaxID=741659 RepID=UPI0019405630|nr:tetratricopeptide repeat protein [Virgisporangium aliadipatigenens]